MRSKISTAALAGALAAASIAVSAPAASANTYCSSSGYTGAGSPAERCTSLSNGILTHWQRSTLPTVSLTTTYYKSGGSAVSVRLGYSQSGTTAYSPYFSISSGQTVKRTWTRTHDYYCYSSVGILNYSGGNYQTPAAAC
ncbi:hypothetical protein ACFQ67_21025 [Streptomyces sp. NPDC056488]|uniref:hypothetical protein n=1 Tax=Streptomyces sp. NPDC056488 TaxID=3345836 RepID=UPI0036A61F4A